MHLLSMYNNKIWIIDLINLLNITIKSEFSLLITYYIFLICNIITTLYLYINKFIYIWVNNGKLGSFVPSVMNVCCAKRGGVGRKQAKNKQRSLWSRPSQRNRKKDTVSQLKITELQREGGYKMAAELIKGKSTGNLDAMKNKGLAC